MRVKATNTIIVGDKVNGGNVKELEGGCGTSMLPEAATGPSSVPDLRPAAVTIVTAVRVTDHGEASHSSCLRE